MPKQYVNNYRPTTRKGERHPNAKLTEQDVLEIRQLSAEGVSRKSLQERFGVSKSAIGNIMTGRTWGNVLNKKID
jgi:hypothetical protein